jgi:hypothetical protein
MENKLSEDIAHTPFRTACRRPSDAFIMACVRLSALMLILSYPLNVLATESGMSHYLPGNTATLIDLAPTKSGWVVQPIYLHYSGKASASRSIPLAGVVSAGLTVNINTVLFGGLYTFERTVLGARYSAGAYLPYVWVDAEANVTTSLGTARRGDTASGIGDMMVIPAMLAWKSGFWQYSALLPISAPTGGYERGRLANQGLNYWTFDPTAGASYNNEKNGFNAALFAGIALNTRNNATDYQSGGMVHLDGSVQQILPAGPGFLAIGAEAFFLQQVTGDSGSGATLGDFKGRTVGVGPAISYILPRGKQTFVVEVRWLPQLDVDRQLKGDYVWLKGAYQF